MPEYIYLLHDVADFSFCKLQQPILVRSFLVIIMESRAIVDAVPAGAAVSIPTSDDASHGINGAGTSITQGT